MKDGIYTDITIKEYHGNRTHISSTNLRKARRSLKEFRFYQDGKISEEKSCFDFGNAFELALIDKKGFENHVAIMQDQVWINEALEEKPELKSPRSSKKYQELFKGFTDENKGKYLINDTGNESFETIEYMLTSCYQDRVIKKLLENIEYQTSIFWTDKVTGLRLKTRPDVCKLNKNVVVDVKTADDGSPEAFSKALANYDYPFQACMQIDGVQQSGYMTVDSYFWLVVEKKPPYNATLYQFSPEDIRYCMDEYTYVKECIRKAYESNLFPGYTQRSDNKFGVLTAQIPLWYKTI
jgi:exodeoxyribonuclease VIII